MTSRQLRFQELTKCGSGPDGTGKAPPWPGMAPEEG